MNKRSDQREKLLAETFHGEWEEGPSAGFARAAAAHARRQRALRRTLAASGIAAAAVTTAMLLAPRHPPAASHETSVAKIAPAYEIISDDELLATVKDQPLLVVRGENGRREFVLLEN